MNSTAGTTVEEKKQIPHEAENTLYSESFFPMPDRQIGIVRFFNQLNGYGFGSIVTHAVPVSSCKDNLAFLHIREGDCPANLKTGDWICFTRKENSAKNATLLTFDKEGLLTALHYCGSLSILAGEDKERRVRYDEHILHHVISGVLKNPGGKKILFRTLCEFLEAYTPEAQHSIVLKWKNDDEVRLLIRSAFLNAAEALPHTPAMQLLGERLSADIIHDSLLTDAGIHWKLLENIIKLPLSASSRAKIRHELGREAESHPEQTAQFLKNTKLSFLQILCSDMEGGEEKKESFFLAEMLYGLPPDEFSLLFSPDTALPDSVNFFLYLTEGSRQRLKSIKNWPLLTRRLASHNASHLQKFLTLFLSEKMEEPAFLHRIPAENLAKALCSCPEDETCRILERLPEDSTLETAHHLMVMGNPAASAFLDAEWQKLKNEISYVVFDLELNVQVETEEQTIRQFAYLAENHIHLFEGETQLDLLNRALSSTGIVVGHNIRQWDLPVLAARNIHTQAFIWDTLEMEILLDPCRYAYSLHTSHHAGEDTDLTDRLFWNQLYRLAQRPGLCSRLKDFLPAGINNMLTRFQRPHFSEAFRQSAGIAARFFQKKTPIDEKLERRLKELGASSEKGRKLIIAPKALWPSLALYLPLSFPHAPEGRFDRISREKLEKNPLPNPLAHMMLLRFCEECRTPLVANLAAWLRIPVRENTGNAVVSQRRQAGGFFRGLSHLFSSAPPKTPPLPCEEKITFSDEILAEYLCECDGDTDCIDVDAFDDANLFHCSYTHICIIGDALEDRLHKHPLCEHLTFEKLSSLDCRVCLQLAGGNHAGLDEADRKKLGIIPGRFAENVWMERRSDGTFTVFQNYRYQEYRQTFLDHFAVKPEYLEWKLQHQDEKSPSPRIVRSARHGDFSCTERRLNDSPLFHSAYWVYQFALLSALHRLHPSMPLVYVVNEREEVSTLEEYAATLGFFVPRHGTGFRRLEYIGNHEHGLVIIARDQFLGGIGSYRTDRPFCHVWDNLNIDLYRTAWKHPPFDDALLNPTQENEEQSGALTTRECILALWPVYERLYSLIKANCSDSLLYLIDEHFDDYPDLADICRTSATDIAPWKDEASYEVALKQAQQIFKDSPPRQAPLNTEAAMKKISELFIGGNEWRPVQKDILPHMLEKRGDCVISMPTGGGKSVLFQGPALYRSASGRRLTLVVSPLRALMQDQVENLYRQGFRDCVDYLNADRMYAETQQIYRRMRSGSLTLLYVTPERFRIQGFQHVLQQRMEKDGGLDYIVFDEAHCITQWGNEFRPDYRNALRYCVELKKKYGVMIALFSATITKQEEQDFRSFLPELQRLGQTAEDYNPVRQHIGIEFVFSGHDFATRLQAVLAYIREKDIDFRKSRMLVFCRRRRDCEELAEQLEAVCTISEENVLSRCSGHIGYYHAGLTDVQRNDVYQRFKSDDADRIFLLCATKAFGMGMDIPNVHYIVHLSPPSVLEDYLQEVGRAGRNESMYREVFSEGDRIPAVCLCSAIDFKNLKELLLKSQIAWSDLSEVKERILTYIRQFRSVKKACDIPVVVPFDIWLKSYDARGIEETTATRLVFQWLEKTGHIRLRYLKPAHLDLLLEDVPAPNPGILTPYISLYRYLLENIRKGEQTQVAVQSLCASLRLSLPRLMDGLLLFSSLGLLRLHETMYCLLTDQRHSETLFMLKEQENIYTLHLAMEGARRLLKDCVRLRTLVIDKTYREEFSAGLLEGTSYRVHVRKNPQATPKNRHAARQETSPQTAPQTEYAAPQELYMPWEKELEQHRKYAILKFKTFKAHVIGKGMDWIFLILSMTPGVTFKNDGATQRVTVHNTEWKDFLDMLEQDCWNWLNFISRHDSLFPGASTIHWASAMEELGFTSPRKGFAYFQNVLGLLKRLGYIAYSPLVKNGIEIFTTEKSELAIDAGEDSSSDLFSIRKSFDELERTKKVRLVCMDVFSRLQKQASEDSLQKRQGDFIRRYFQCRETDDYLRLVEDFVPSQEHDDVLNELNDVALRQEEARLNAEQSAIYSAPKDLHINVQAGPGSGKTHVLTLRCARLIYKEKTEPEHILVLAYNRAVVTELRNRLNSLFSRLGLSRFAHRLHIYTFHALARRCLGKRLDNIRPEAWETMFLNFLHTEQNAFKTLFPQLEYVLVDEFQDVTQNRLNSLLYLHEMFPKARFFTIGDINQSIYGFDRVEKKDDLNPAKYAELLDPRPYYRQLEAALHPQNMTMATNYRSYQKILDAAAPFATCPEALPHSAPELMRHEPSGCYVFQTDNSIDKSREAYWYHQLPRMLDLARQENASGEDFRQIRDIAVFFRTNSEVYQGYGRIRNTPIEGVRLRIQGTEIAEFWRKKEVFALLELLEPMKAEELEPEHSSAALRELVLRLKQEWLSNGFINDGFNLDVVYTVMLDFMESIRTDETRHTMAELVDYIKEVTSGRDGQIFKIYDHYQAQGLSPASDITVILTTMHKVKGLEFDAVLIPPSGARLPLTSSSSKNEAFLADMEEERRLRFVAYTRAKKYLHTFLYEREKALEKKEDYAQNEKISLMYMEREPSLGNYYLGFNALARNFAVNAFIRSRVNINDPVELHRDIRGKYGIFCHGTQVGQLSGKSTLAKKMQEKDNSSLYRLFVNDVLVWTYEETLRKDEKDNTDFAGHWSAEARAQGYVYVVDITGIGTPVADRP